MFENYFGISLPKKYEQYSRSKKSNSKDCFHLQKGIIQFLQSCGSLHLNLCPISYMATSILVGHKVLVMSFTALGSGQWIPNLSAKRLQVTFDFDRN